METKQDEVELIQPDAKTGKLPDMIPSDKYIGVKEAYGRAKEKAASLEEKLKASPNAEEHAKLKADLEAANAKIKTYEEEKTKANEKTATELRDALKEKGVSEEKYKDKTVAELQLMLDVLGDKSSLPDLKGGGGSSVDLSKLSRNELAKQAYKESAGRKR